MTIPASSATGGCGTRKHDLVDARVRADGRAHIATAGYQVQHAGRQDFLGHFHELAHGYRCIFRGLEDHGIADAQGRDDMPDGNHQGPVPGGDGTHHTQGTAVNFYARFVVVLQHVHG
jgi:hypothetical protein